MKELLIFLVGSLVNDPDAIVVEEIKENDRDITYKFSVAKEDMGRVIGRQGRIAKAIRTVIKSAGAREGIRVHVDIVDAE